MQTLPERSQRDHWKYLYKNKNMILVTFIKKRKFQVTCFFSLIDANMKKLLANIVKPGDRENKDPTC